jgi:hypothetical protein
MNRRGVTVALVVSLAAACATAPEPVEPEIIEAEETAETAEEAQEVSDVPACMEVPLEESPDWQPLESLNTESLTRALDARRGRIECCYQRFLARSRVSGIVRVSFVFGGNRVAELTLAGADSEPLSAEWDEPFQACLTAILSDIALEGGESLDDDELTRVVAPLSFLIGEHPEV